MFEYNFANDNAFIVKLKDEYSEHVHEVFGLTLDDFVCAVLEESKSLMRTARGL